MNPFDGQSQSIGLSPMLSHLQPYLKVRLIEPLLRLDFKVWNLNFRAAQSYR